MALIIFRSYHFVPTSSDLDIVTCAAVLEYTNITQKNDNIFFICLICLLFLEITYKSFNKVSSKG